MPRACALCWELMTAKHQAARVAERECRRDRSTAWGQQEKAIRYTYNEKTEEWDMRRVYIVCFLPQSLLVVLFS